MIYWTPTNVILNKLWVFRNATSVIRTFHLSEHPSVPTCSDNWSPTVNGFSVTSFRTFVNGFSVTSFRTFFADPLPSFNWWAVSLGREKLKWHQLAHYHLISQQGRVHTEKLKPMIKGTISGRMLSSGISHVVFAWVYSEKTRLKKCWIMIIIIITEKTFTTWILTTEVLAACSCGSDVGM